MRFLSLHLIFLLWAASALADERELDPWQYMPPHPAVQPALADERELDLRCLRESYGVQGTERDAEGREWLLLENGVRVLYDDGRADDAAWMLEHGDVRDSMAQPYPLEPQRPAPEVGEHPGRVRSYPLLRALYGPSRQAVAAQLEGVALAGQRVPFSRSAGAAEALRRVDAALRELLRTEPGLRRYVVPLGGGFVWRGIAGAARLSPHSFGMAVDVNPRLGAYWRWSGGGSHPTQRTYPSAIVAIFEAHGFVWGGKWREYDLMHFEYRPEIICKARWRQATGGARMQEQDAASMLPDAGQEAKPQAEQNAAQGGR